MSKAFILTWTMVAVVAAAVGIGLATRFVLKMKPDNRVEQVCERVILNETGIAVDLSPDVDGMDLTPTTYNHKLGAVAKREVNGRTKK